MEKQNTKPLEKIVKKDLKVLESVLGDKDGAT